MKTPDSHPLPVLPSLRVLPTSKRRCFVGVLGVFLFLLTGPGCTPCQSYCTSFAGAGGEAYAQLLLPEQYESEEFVDSDGQFQAAAWRNRCNQAPNTSDCAECAHWQQEQLGDSVALDCTVVFERSEETTDEATRTCSERCDHYKLEGAP